MSNPVRCWAPKGVRPLVTAQRVRECLYVYSAACPSDGENFSLILPTCNSKSMELFLDEFSSHYRDYQAVMIMDRASWHPSKTCDRWNNIRFIRQPARSPELNPVEHLWEYLRENYFHNRIFDSIDDVENELCLTLSQLHHDKDTVRSFTGFHWAIL